MQETYIAYDVSWIWISAAIFIMAFFYMLLLVFDYVDKSNGVTKYILTEVKTIFRTLTLGLTIALIVLYIGFMGSFAKVISKDHNITNGREFNLYIMKESLSHY